MSLVFMNGNAYFNYYLQKDNCLLDKYVNGSFKIKTLIFINLFLQNTLL